MVGRPNSSLLVAGSKRGGEEEAEGGWRWTRCEEERLVPGGWVSLIVEGALLPGHGLDRAWHGGRLERGRSVRMEGVADGVDGGEGPLGGQRESVLVLRLEGEEVGWGGGGERRERSHRGRISVKLVKCN